MKGKTKTGYTIRIRMNDYVGAGIFANVTWATDCAGRPHVLGLMSHTCARCGATPTSIEYEARS